VADGAAALQAARRAPPDLVLADVMMPELDGFELLQALRADPDLEALPVILLSARAGEEATLEGLTAGANDYLVKPFSAREVLARIATHLEIARLRQQADARAHALDRANQEMSASLSLVGHELRAPITNIRLQAELLSRRLNRLATTTAGGGRSQEALANARLSFEEGLERIDGQTLRIERLVEEVVEAARIQTGHLDLRLAPCDLGPLVEEVVAEQQLAWPERRLVLRKMAADPMWVEADAERTWQVVTNYLTNALKYAPSTSPVEIVVRRTEQQVRVEVRDEGPGIPRDERDHVWERFHRVPGTQVHGDSGGGLGLGLYLCKALIEGQGGQVGVESLPGRGSAFWFTLPLADPASHDHNTDT
jgi:signal transduction histidine kinase